MIISSKMISIIIERAKAILKVIENAMGKTIADKSSEQTIKLYGCSLDSEDSVV